MTRDPKNRMAQLGEALELYLECAELRDPAAIEAKLAARPELRDLVRAMLGRKRARGRPALGRGADPTDDPAPA